MAARVGYQLTMLVPFIAAVDVIRLSVRSRKRASIGAPEEICRIGGISKPQDGAVFICQESRVLFDEGLDHG
jgi:hypothetical protein